jgi:hypothetical protein
LLKDGTFSLPSKRELINRDTDIEIVIADATEQETEHPKKTTLILYHKSYSGKHKCHSITYKKPKGGKLTSEQKKFNSYLSKFRIFIEHINRRIKRFKMFQGRYRNKQRKHHKCISLICGLYNSELGFWDRS